MPSALGSRLYSQFVEARNVRRELEDRFLRDLRAFKGVYDPEVERLIGKNRSHTYTKQTRIKVKAVDSRLMDLMFPGGTEKNWSLQASPVSDHPAPPDQLAQFMAVNMRLPTPEEQVAMAHAEAERRAALMSQELEDQLSELKYRKIMRQVIHSGNLFGTGFLKGPLVEERPQTAWVPNAMGGWAPQTTTKLRPYFEFVPVWDIYPDPAALWLTDADYVYQRYVFNRSKLLELAARPDFDGKTIRDYLDGHREGTATFLPWELELRAMDSETTRIKPRERRYEVLEFWGTMRPDDFGALQLEEPPDADMLWVNVWLLGDEIIKAVPQPIEGVRIPLFAYYFSKDESSIFGDGIALIMRDDQEALNAATRAMLDNAAITAGPQLDVNVDLLADGEDPRDVRPFKTWLRTGIGSEANTPAIRAISLQSHTQEYLEIAKRFDDNIHELTVPAYMHGDAEKGVGRTVGGLSMLMSTAQVPLKEQMASLDDDITEPMVTALYNWNMQFSEREDIKGDYKVVVKGTTSLVAREVRSQALEQFAASTLNQFDAPYIDRVELLRQRVLAQELPESIIYNPQQMQAMQYGFQGMPGAAPGAPGQPGLPADAQALGGAAPGGPGPVPQGPAGGGAEAAPGQEPAQQ